jgi:hypothetical protein
VIDLMSATKPVLKKALVDGAIKRESVEVTDRFRGLGKTSALIEFAMEYGFVVVCFHSGIAKRLRSEYGYQNIIGQSDIGSQRIDSKFVHDEGVDLSRLKNLDVVTGFVNYEMTGRLTTSVTSAVNASHITTTNGGI